MNSLFHHEKQHHFDDFVQDYNNNSAASALEVPTEILHYDIDLSYIHMATNNT